MYHAPHTNQNSSVCNMKKHQNEHDPTKVAHTIITFTKKQINSANGHKKHELQMIKAIAEQQIQNIYKLNMIKNQYKDLKHVTSTQDIKKHIKLSQF